MHTNVVRQLKKILLEASVLRKPRYDHGHSIIGTLDTSPIGIVWAISQEEEDGSGMQFDLVQRYLQKAKELILK